MLLVELVIMAIMSIVPIENQDCDDAGRICDGDDGGGQGGRGTT